MLAADRSATAMQCTVNSHTRSCCSLHCCFAFTNTFFCLERCMMVVMLGYCWLGQRRCIQPVKENLTPANHKRPSSEDLWEPSSSIQKNRPVKQKADSLNNNNNN